MNINKLIATIGAFAINALVIAAFSGSGPIAILQAGTSYPTPRKHVVTLPTITVHPSAAEFRTLERPHKVTMIRHESRGSTEA